MRRMVSMSFGGVAVAVVVENMEAEIAVCITYLGQ